MQMCLSILLLIRLFFRSYMTQLLGICRPLSGVESVVMWWRLSILQLSLSRDADATQLHQIITHCPYVSHLYHTYIHIKINSTLIAKFKKMSTMVK